MAGGAAAGRRVVTVLCPDWPVVAAGVEPEEPAAVLRAGRVIARSPAAAGAGVDAGMRRRQAQRTCPRLRIVEDDPDRDAAAFEAVVRAIAALTPKVEVTEAGVARLPARGPARLHGGEEAFLDVLLATVRSAASGVGGSARVQVAIADGRFASTVAAHRAVDAPVVVAAGGSTAHLAPLGVGWLARTGEADADLVDLFARLGLATLGALAALDPADVLARFGHPGVAAHRCAAGLDDQAMVAVEPTEAIAAEVGFDEPVGNLEPVVFAAKALADELIARLGRDGSTCTRLLVAAEAEGGERDERAWYRSSGLGAAEVVERVRWQLAGWIGSGRLGSGIVALRIEAVEVTAADGDQRRLWGGSSAADERAARAVARLTSLVGDDAVLVPAWRGGRLPAERCAWVPAAALDLGDRRSSRRRLGPLVAEGDQPWPGSLPAPSPTVVLPIPEPSVLAGEDGRPLRVDGRGELDGVPATLAVADRVPRPVLAWAGPWIVDERWWDVAGRRRLARLQVICDDHSAYLVAAEHRRWWLLGSYR